MDIVVHPMVKVGRRLTPPEGEALTLRRHHIPSPVAATATPVSSAAEHQQKYDDNQDQLHRHGNLQPEICVRPCCFNGGRTPVMYARGLSAVRPKLLTLGQLHQVRSIANAMTQAAFARRYNDRGHFGRSKSVTLRKRQVFAKQNDVQSWQVPGQERKFRARNRFHSSD
jgi:hypothetical protein